MLAVVEVALGLLMLAIGGGLLVPGLWDWASRSVFTIDRLIAVGTPEREAAYERRLRLLRLAFPVVWVPFGLLITAAGLAELF